MLSKLKELTLIDKLIVAAVVCIVVVAIVGEYIKKHDKEEVASVINKC